jgi:hypothetical protein
MRSVPLRWQNGGMADAPVPNSLLSAVPEPIFDPNVIAYQLLIEHKPLWSKLRQQRGEFKLLTVGITGYRLRAREYRIEMGGTLLELQTAYSVPGHGHFIRLAEKTLGCGKSTIYRYINLYRDTNGILRPQRNRHLSQSGTDETTGENQNSSESESKRGRICDVKLFFDSGTDQLREWNDAIKLILLWNEPRCNSASEAALFAVKKLAAELKARRDTAMAAEAEYVDEQGVARNTATSEPMVQVHKPVTLDAAEQAVQEEEIIINKRTHA